MNLTIDPIMAIEIKIIYHFLLNLIDLLANSIPPPPYDIIAN